MFRIFAYIAAVLLVYSLQSSALGQSNATGTVYGKHAALLEDKRQAVWAPNGRYKVETIPRSKMMDDTYPRNHLFLFRSGTKLRTPVKMRDGSNGYDHFVEVLWAPDSKAFFVNEWDPGDTSAFLVNINDLSHPIDVGDKLKKLITDAAQKKVFDGDLPLGLQVYAITWKSSKSVELRIRGAFELTYLWDLKDKLLFVRKKNVK